MKQFIKDWLIFTLLSLAILGQITWQVWRAYRQYQVEKAVIELSQKK